MKDIIEKILKAETDAQSILIKARKDADGIILTAQQGAVELKDQSKKDLYREKERLLRETEIEMIRKRENAISEAKANANSVLKDKPSLVESIADRVFKEIIKA